MIDLKYSTPGSVIPPRETIADVVPDDSRLVTEARVRTEDIGRIHRGQTADIRFTAFKYRTTQLVHGKVLYVSADRLVDRATGAPYYSVLVEADASSLANAGDLKLLAGMPAEIYIKGRTGHPCSTCWSRSHRCCAMRRVSGDQPGSRSGRRRVRQSPVESTACVACCRMNAVWYLREFEIPRDSGQERIASRPSSP